jgi:hypothetical protein
MKRECVKVKDERSREQDRPHVEESIDQGGKSDTREEEGEVFEKDPPLLIGCVLLLIFGEVETLLVTIL